MIDKNNYNPLINTPPKVVVSIFTGNDYELLLDHDNVKNSSSELESLNKREKIEKNKSSINLNTILSSINYELVKNKSFTLGDSYLFNVIKLLMLRQKKDGKDFYKFYGGSTFIPKMIIVIFKKFNFRFQK